MGRYANQLVILSGIRNLDETTLKLLEDMPITDISLEDFYSYRKGMEKGMEKGVQKGMQQKQRGIITKMLQSNLLTIEQIADIVGVEVSVVVEIQSAIKSND